jgi:carbamoyltransferase
MSAAVCWRSWRSATAAAASRRGRDAIVVGLSAHYHDAACCLLRGGRIVAAAQEERFTRRKGEPRLPVEALRYCLGEAGVGLHQVNRVAYYELPELRRQRQLAMGRVGDADPDPLRAIREQLGYEGVIDVHPHHASHAASAFLFSPHAGAAVLTADGVGEWTTTAWWAGHDESLELLGEVRFPHSLGLFYSTITAWLGFPVNRGEGTVMGLAAWGRAERAAGLRSLVRSDGRGGFELVESYFDCSRGMYSSRLCELLGEPRAPGEEISERHADVAAAAQALLEELLLEQVDGLHHATGLPALCLAGGVALNCSANGKILAESAFDELFIQPAAGDAGGALGAAALSWVALTGERPRPMDSARLGPRWDPEPWLRATPVGLVDYRERPGELHVETAARLDGGQIIGWFDGRMELGPRALGGRSILADPRRVESRERLNRRIKQREAFRPFAPMLLQEASSELFDMAAPSPFMLRAHRLRPEMRAAVPAVTHVDGSARPQTVDRRLEPGLAGLLDAWRARTGCPALLNTSLNLRGEPLACTPADALFTLAVGGLDALVVDGFLVDSIPDEWPELLPWWRRPKASASRRDLYTF